MPSRSIRRRDLRRLFIAASVLLAGLALAGLAHARAAVPPAGAAKAALQAETAHGAQVVKESGAKPD